MIRKTETAKDYKTLTDSSVNWEMCHNLKTLTNYLNEQAKNDTLLRSEAVKISVALNNLLKDLGL